MLRMLRLLASVILFTLGAAFLGEVWTIPFIVCGLPFVPRMLPVTGVRRLSAFGNSTSLDGVSGMATEFTREGALSALGACRDSVGAAAAGRDGGSLTSDPSSWRVRCFMRVEIRRAKAILSESISL